MRSHNISYSTSYCLKEKQLKHNLGFFGFEGNRRWLNGNGPFIGGRRGVNGFQRRGSLNNLPFNDNRPDLHDRPGPPYPGPPPRAPNLPLDPTRIHPSEPEPVFQRPGKILIRPRQICQFKTQ